MLTTQWMNINEEAEDACTGPHHYYANIIVLTSRHSLIIITNSRLRSYYCCPTSLSLLLLYPLLLHSLLGSLGLPVVKGRQNRWIVSCVVLVQICHLSYERPMGFICSVHLFCYLLRKIPNSLLLLLQLLLHDHNFLQLFGKLGTGRIWYRQNKNAAFD